MVLGYFRRAITCYCQISKKYIIIYFLKKVTVTRRNPLQIAQNQANLRENIR